LQYLTFERGDSAKIWLRSPHFYRAIMVKAC